MLFSINKYQFSINVIFLFLMTPFSVTALDSFNDVNETLREAIVSIENQRLSSHQYSVNNEVTGFDAWIDDSELKWGVSEMGDFETQKLSFEVKLKNLEQINAEQQILNFGQIKVDIKLVSLLENRLKLKYSSLIDYVQKIKQKNILKQQHTLANSELNNWKIKANSNDFRADKLQQADLTIDSIWVNEIKNNTMLNRYRNKYQKNNVQRSKYANTSLNDVISIPQMLNITQDILGNGTYQQYSTSIRRAELNAFLEIKQKQREDAQGKLSLNAVKFEYDKKDDGFGFSIGMKIPVTKNTYNNRLQKQSLLNAKMDVQHSIIDITEQLQDKTFQIQEINDRWLSNQKLLHKINTRIKRLSKTNYINLLLDLKKERLKRRLEQVNIKILALKEYIGFLNIADMLSAKPYRNWIQSGTPVIL